MSAIGTPTSLGGPEVRTPTRGFSEISSEEFMSMILSELTNQDPLEPNDTENLLNQISTIRSIESDESMLSSLDSMVESSEFASAANLIGTLVSGLTEENRRVADVVLSVSRTLEGPVLNLFDGSRVPFENVDEVVAPLSLDEDGGTDDPDGDGSDGDGTDGGNG
jgi:flagellar basal-body rod modification protein FlgD